MRKKGVIIEIKIYKILIIKEKSSELLIKLIEFFFFWPFPMAGIWKEILTRAFLSNQQRVRSRGKLAPLFLVPQERGDLFGGYDLDLKNHS